MAGVRFTAEDMDRYGESDSEFFSLPNDKDVARVRFMYAGLKDLEGHVVHKVKLANGKERYVGCLRNYNDPMSACPLCAEGYSQVPKFFILIYNEDTQKVNIWDRGKTYLKRLSSLCVRYPKLVGTLFEIERNGARGSKETTYEIFPIENDGTTMEDLPEAPDVYGTIVLKKTAEEMEDFLDTGDFPETRKAGGRNSAPPRRRSTGRAVPARDEGEEAPRRRRRAPEPEDDFEEEEPPKTQRRASRQEEPEEEAEEPPRRRRRLTREEPEEELEEAPKAKTRRRVEEEPEDDVEEEEAPKPRRRRRLTRDEEEADDLPF